jgi:hypothetical protein
MTEDTINGLKKNIKEVPQKFISIPEDKLSFKPSPKKWSKKEILGHLCDSAICNYSRFIRAQFEQEPMDARSYAQDDWVYLNSYKDISTSELVQLWTSLNTQIVNIISKIPSGKLGIKCKCEGKIHTLQWIIDDYLTHMNHHLEQIFD